MPEPGEHNPAPVPLKHHTETAYMLLLAVVIWATVHIALRKEILPPPGPGELRTFRGVPVAVLKAANDRRALRVTPTEVSVTATGKLPLLQTLTAREIEVFINLTDAHDTVGAEKTLSVRVPDGLTVLRVEPHTVRVEALSE